MQLPSSLSAPVSASRFRWRCCMVRLLQRRGVSAGLVAPFSPRSGAPFVCEGGGRSARCAAYVPSPRDLQSACTGRQARPGTRSTGPSFARAAPRAWDSPRRWFLSVWSVPLPRRFPERPCGMGHPLAQGPRRNVRARVTSCAGHLQRRRGLTLIVLTAPWRRPHCDALAKQPRRATGLPLWQPA